MAHASLSPDFYGSQYGLPTVDSTLQDGPVGGCGDDPLGTRPGGFLTENPMVSSMDEEPIRQFGFHCDDEIRRLYEGSQAARKEADELITEAEQLVAAVPWKGLPVTAKFGTGAVRSSDAEGYRFDLIHPIAIKRLAMTCHEGAVKYDDFNWEHGMPAYDLINHAIKHCYEFLSGDRSEDHLAHAMWNCGAAIASLELWPHLNEGTLRGPGCTPPSKPTGPLPPPTGQQ